MPTQPVRGFSFNRGDGPGRRNSIQATGDAVINMPSPSETQPSAIIHDQRSGLYYAAVIGSRGIEVLKWGAERAGGAARWMWEHDTETKQYVKIAAEILQAAGKFVQAHATSEQYKTYGNIAQQLGAGTASIANGYDSAKFAHSSWQTGSVVDGLKAGAAFMGAVGGITNATGQSSAMPADQGKQQQAIGHTFSAIGLTAFGDPEAKKRAAALANQSKRRDFMLQDNDSQLNLTELVDSPDAVESSSDTYFPSNSTGLSSSTAYLNQQPTQRARPPLAEQPAYMSGGLRMVPAGRTLPPSPPGKRGSNSSSDGGSAERPKEKGKEKENRRNGTTRR
ncbi:hypothetical protein LXH13_12315 [Streptomyces spinosirectus]|uniref:hypothetical protein n=1 Tax=Streptomyces TaxID=1883 RepID=UPI0011B23BB1|nr:MULTISPECIES: hypothetical protein [Streptomyces]MBY8342457.1 hypothetical protein [Streptomyces plumbidurans]UIR17775.1 hypothetical protein LXH13_12315 [Streptomyces spinosirectus]